MNIRTATRFNVRSIPTILFFKNGKLVDQVIGAVPRPQLETKFKEHAA
jgi:thioredoxin 1